MLNLNLRSEFQSRILKGTAIDFNKEVNKSAKEFLEMTYPSNDLIKTIESINLREARPVVLIGERGQGKSHLLTTLYHSFANSETTKTWLDNWAVKLQRPELAQIQLRPEMHVIAESLHWQNYKFLWDLILDRHPYGQFIKGKWEGQEERKTDVLGRDLLLEMFKKQPTAIILDEFQTWYDGLTNTKQYPRRQWAFNFIQTLAEIAEEHPDLLVLVVSVRNGQSDAYQQIHRNNPVIVDFKGQYVKRDRKKLLLHRLFENRSQISEKEISAFINVHVNEYYRLFQVPELEKETLKQDFLDSWPFSPNLLNLLEDQILISTDAQETRDLIKILANLFKQRSKEFRLITAAGFSIEEDASGVTAFLDSVSNEYYKTLREKAQRNLSAVNEAVKQKDHIPHVADILSSLWIRSLAIDKFAGAERAVLQMDITQDRAIDDNNFIIEMDNIINNSFNIHEVGSKLIFKEEENPQAKLLAFARNNKLFQDGSDIDQLAKEVRYVIGGAEDITPKYKVVVLRDNWFLNPWESLEENDHPSRWDNRIPIIVIPEYIEKTDETLGKWLKEHIAVKRNTIRFLLPQQGQGNIYRDDELLINARTVLKANEWMSSEPVYRGIHKQYQDKLRLMLNSLFNRFAILDIWNYNDVKQCEFHLEAHQAKGKDIPEAIDFFIRQSIFEPEDFNELVLAVAENKDSVGKLLKDLQEPRPGGQECIPWLGETEIKEKLIRLCAEGKIGIDIRGMEQLILHLGESEDEAWHRMKGKLGTGSYLDQTHLMLPSAFPTNSFIDKQKEDSDAGPEADSTESTSTNGINTGSTVTNTEDSEINPKNDETNIGNGTNIYGGQNGDGNIFNPPVLRNGKVKQLSTEPTSALNLIGKIEGWGINTGTPIKNISLNIKALTGAQLQQLLRVLPDGVTYGLDLEKEERS